MTYRMVLAVCGSYVGRYLQMGSYCVWELASNKFYYHGTALRLCANIYWIFLFYQLENTPLNYCRHGPVNLLANWQMKDHVYILSNSVKVEVCSQNILKFHWKFAIIKFMEVLSNVLVM